MSTQVTVQGTTYTLNSQGDNPPWGDQLSSLLQALVNVANTQAGTADINTTSFTVANNQSAVANITSLSFDPSTVRSAIIQYSIYRSSSINELSECGIILLSYKTTAGTWEFANTCTGNSQITFSITNAGQFQYTSTDIGSTSYVGKMKFNAKSFLQA